VKPFVDAVPDGAIVRAVAWPAEPGEADTIDLDTELSGPATAADGRHPLPAPKAFASAMERHGIGDGDVVVAYDQHGGVIAARLVWMLRALGERAAVAPSRVHLSVADAVKRTRLGQFTPRPWPSELLATIDDVLDLQVPLIDARPAERFRGDGPLHPLDPRPGHIPGARSLPVREHADAGGRLLAEATLRARFAAAGVTEPGFISSCGSGVTACHNLLVAEQLGLGPGRLYVGSWSQYAADPGRPAELGA